jgi:bifunctional enzyme CysN/CysC
MTATISTTTSRGLLRFATVGSVDDGKSTLIGRLLYDSKSIFEDQLEHIEAVSQRRGQDFVDLALLTDGLRAEREQGITIDVAYRYFATPERRFIIADCPGHIQYTRNMITGASTVDLAILLVDARHGIVEQTRRHSLLVSLLGVPHLVICVNKMDLVGHDRTVFEAIRAEFGELAARLGVRDVSFFPISALAGDNVVDPSPNMPWFHGGTLLAHLEQVDVAAHGDGGARFPVQYVIRPQRNGYHDYRGYAGRVEGGVLKVGDEVTVLPSGLGTRIARIDTFAGPVDEAGPQQAVTLLLDDDLDIGRGDMICRPHDVPHIGQDLEAMVAWMDHTTALVPGKVYAIKHTTRTARARVGEVHHRLDIDTLHRNQGVDTLGSNEVGRVSLRTTAPLFYDDYRRNRATGSFILVDEVTNQTVAGGMLLPPPGR